MDLFLRDGNLVAFLRQSKEEEEFLDAQEEGLKQKEEDKEYKDALEGEPGQIEPPVLSPAIQIQTPENDANSDAKSSLHPASFKVLSKLQKDVEELKEDVEMLKLEQIENEKEFKEIDEIIVKIANHVHLEDEPTQTTLWSRLIFRLQRRV
jgi:hypothetical protein